MKFRRKWKPGGHPRCSPQPYHRYRKKRLLNKPCIGYEAEESCKQKSIAEMKKVPQNLHS